MTFGDAVTTCLTRKYATFRGRASRSEYWWFTLFGTTVSAVFVIVIMVNFNAGTLPPVILVAYAFFCLLFVLPFLSVHVRRLHDIGRSRWWLWIS
ncbi:DUF805 domain-containing protein [Jannaschia donghaensis]|uniref:Inner membrane protein YhaI n=1 Tax=Jannaschia donghaensis TaxID=420998 RepID=A0A0M6YIM8_9RHOB|nr:DUF805 domain-containing protein [Jannaschia donghaensis]CTQ49784.1 Inner membrane protein YhaI [Jannaschia donghaensis]